MTSVLFTDIEENIIAYLNTAKVSIDIAVSWFTNSRIFSLLNEKITSQVKIRIIILNDRTNNNKRSLDFDIIINKGAEIYTCTGPNLMHSKYCIIDDSTVLTGSANFSNHIEFNDENILICSDPAIVREYKNNFNMLSGKYARIRKLVKSTEELKIESQFIPVDIEAIEMDYSKCSFLQVCHIDLKKNFIILRFMSRVTKLGRMFDIGDERTRFLSLTENEIKKVNLFDCILYPRIQQTHISEYFDKKGKRRVAIWLTAPTIGLNDFIPKSKIK